MICPVCEQRHAGFPKQDFGETKDGGLFVKRKGAEQRRAKVLASDEKMICSPDCKEDFETLMDGAMQINYVPWWKGKNVA